MGPPQIDFSGPTDYHDLASLLKEVEHRNRHAFEAFYRRTLAKLSLYCRGCTINRELSEDLVQDTYAIIWQRAYSFDPSKGSPVTWMISIARNRHIDLLRKRQKAAEFPLESALDIADDKPLPDAAAIEENYNSYLESCIGRLNKLDQDTLRRTVLRGQTYVGFAKYLGLPLSTIKARVRRAKSRLREIMLEDLI